MKLRKLVLAGFKSFADKTEFDFDDGITAVVGPNGCGKSNVVDAVKWVLGEQSAKSLRGGEMLDVIFNGSSARKAAGHAEVTLVFDNSDHKLQTAALGEGTQLDTVAITRRLFRDGTSEYLINKNAARLRDIKEMFMDTGVGVDAYSLIEQGRVEAFLQASQDDRRSIFDEAAGISKYKARKKEALRKLERVEQNLLRVNDVLQEVDKRLRSIKYQAGKARNYQTYSEQLKGLRSLHLLAQYHTLTAQRTDLQKQFDAGSDALAAVAARLEQLESARQASEAELADLERSIREVEGRLAAVGASATACEQRAEMLAGRVRELGEQMVSFTNQSEQLEAKIDSVQERAVAQQGALEQLTADASELTQKYETVRKEHNEAELSITRMAASLDDEKAGTIDLMRRTSQLHNEMQGARIRRENLHGQQNNLSNRAQQVQQTLRELLEGKSEVETQLAEVRQLIAATQQRLEETRVSSRQVSDAEGELRNELSSARERRSGIASRRGALQEMQNRLEGVNAGVRSVLKAMKSGKLRAMRGMLGDFITTDVEHAPLVEAALAGADQQLVIDRLVDLRAYADEMRAVLGESGSVEVLCLDQVEPLTCDVSVGPPAGDSQTQGGFAVTVSGNPVSGPRVFGRVIDYVRCESFLAPAMWRLLGQTLVVEDLSAAHEAMATLPRGFRFVTRQGQVLEADGRVRLGAANKAAGVVTRRSELTALEQEHAAIEARIAELDQLCKSKKVEREHLEEVQQGLRTAIYEANTERVEAESRQTQLNDQIEKLRREEPLIAKDLDRLAAEIEHSVQTEHEAQTKAAELEEISKQRQAQIELLTEQLSTARSRQGDLTRQMTEAKVSLAQAEEKKRGLAEAIASLLRQSEQMQTDLANARSQIELARQRRADAEASIAKANEEAARLREQREALAAQLDELQESRQGVVERLEQSRKLLVEQRKVSDEAAAQVNALRVQLSEADVRIENLISRANEDGMQLLEACQTYQHDDTRDWNAVAAEIADLKGKIERLGNVNLDSISEQEELEKRQEFLGTQLADIKTSQDQLTELIKRINKESRELFLATFEAVRTNFQELFRKLFGGGKADIMLMDPDDVLESGIEIIARPPGKETRALTLLSGGEKTMTALAMLFSIFRSRPSPFCLLDEVDAALDEANNRRFNALVAEFVTTSQFIVITHSKRTMSMASVLYGVTMQEPGVSKRIAVKFEEAGKMVDSKPQMQPA